mmetsp:Transcript_19131/g.34094  ORF Transcript_19131/g.34094 Transcript_19131/m.34094 type:complete len:116 (-) Transcript_19131:521-868(-)
MTPRRASQPGEPHRAVDVRLELNALLDRRLEHLSVGSNRDRVRRVAEAQHPSLRRRDPFESRHALRKEFVRRGARPPGTIRIGPVAAFGRRRPDDSDSRQPVVPSSPLSRPPAGG